MLCKKRVHALFSEMIMTSLTAEFPTLQDREGTSEMGSAHAKHLDSRESKLQRPCLNFTPQFRKLFVVSSQTLFEVCSFLPFSFWTANAIWQHLSRKLPTVWKSSSVHPRVVIAGDPILTPPGDSADTSPCTVLRFKEMEAASHTFS